MSSRVPPRAGGGPDERAPSDDPARGKPQPDGPTEPVRILYIGGCGRSGSTLLDRILGQIEGLWSVGEIVHIWRRGLGSNQLCGCGQPFRECPFWSAVGDIAYGGWDSVEAGRLVELQHAVDRNRYIPFMIVPWLAPAYRRRMRTYQELLSRLYRGIAEASGGNIVVDSAKHASYAFLLRGVPGIDLRVIHLVRDARGVAHSWTKEIRKPEVTSEIEYMPRYHPARMALRWVSYNLLFHVLRRTHVPSLFVRYESVVRRPREEIERILRFGVGHHTHTTLDFIQDDRVFLASTHTVAGNPMRFQQGPLALRVDDRWRQDMDRTLRRTVGALTWPLMRHYGYRMRGPA